MNIGLLVTEIDDSDVKRICIGASKAARDNGAVLVIIPGKYLLEEASLGEKPFDYQYTALFDYAVSPDFDALIVDIDRIGSKTTILKKQAFLKKFEGMNVLTLSEQEGCVKVNTPAATGFDMEQLGYEAVCDAVFYAKNQVLPPAQEPQEYEKDEFTKEAALAAMSEMSYNFFNRIHEPEKAYGIFGEVSARHGVMTGGILLYDRKISNSIKYPWKKPENINIKNAIIDGQALDFKDGKMMLSSDKFITTFSKGRPVTLILGDLFIGEFQIGLMICEVNPFVWMDRCFDNMLSLVTGMAGISNLEKELRDTTDELYEVQEELARDGSVLDHIGDQDYLTGGLNRRGFFAKAYDMLKENFTQGRYAVVAYIYMESLKRINEMFGHDEGDNAVKRVARILEEVFEGSIYGRIRGDEFAVLIISDEDGRAEALRNEMSTQNAKLLSETNRYINHLQYSICEFGYEENLSLREMLKETDENLQRLKGN